MNRLPNPGGDNDVWGDILNAYLSVEHNADGTLKIRTDGTLDKYYLSPTGGIPYSDLSAGVQASLTLADDAPTTLRQLSDTSGAGSATDKQYLSFDAASGKWIPADMPVASNTAKGIVLLAGDLGGSASADSPTISTGAVTGGKIASATITDANIAGNAAIAKTKLAPLNISDSDVSAISETKITNLQADLTSKAANGQNSDITSLTGLTTPLSISQGGTGSGTQNFVDLSNNQSIGGNKTLSGTTTASALISGSLAVTGGTPASGKVLTSDASGNATWQPLSGLSGTVTNGVLEWNGTSWQATLVTDSSIDTAAGIQVSKLQGGSNGQVLTTSSGGVPVWAAASGGSVTFSKGLASARPAAATAGANAFYFATDTHVLWESDGASWVVQSWDREWIRNGNASYATWRPTYDRINVSSNTVNFSANTATNYCSVPLIQGDVISTLVWCSGTTGLTVGTSASHLWSVVRNPDGTLLAYSADEGSSAAWAASTEKDHAIAFSATGSAITSVTIAATGVYYFGIHSDPGTGGSPVQNTMVGKNVNGNSLTAGLAGQPRLTGHATETYPPAQPALTFTNDNVALYCIGHS